MNELQLARPCATQRNLGGLTVFHCAVLALAVLTLGMPTSLVAADLWFASNDDLVQVDGSSATAVGVLPGSGVGIAVTATGDVWVASRDEARLRRFDANGTLELDLVTPAPLQGIAVAADGSLWCVRPTLNDVWHLDADGVELGTVAVGLVPYGVTIDRDGIVRVSNSFGNSVTRIAPSTGSVTTTAVGFFPTHLCAAPDGTVWVAEKEGVTRLASDGTFLSTVDAFGFPLGIAVARSGDVWVAEQNSHQVLRFSPDGALIGTSATAWKPRGIAALGDGSMAVLCRLGDEVQRFAVDGTSLGSIAIDAPDGLGDLSGLQLALTVDPAGDHDGDGVANAVEASLGFDPLSASSSPATFVRGDADRNGFVLFEDVLTTLSSVLGEPTPAIAECPEALDVNDDGKLDLADPISLIAYLFAAGPAPAAPFPEAGPDPLPGLGYPCSP